jgi:hypothetical protein
MSFILPVNVPGVVHIANPEKASFNHSGRISVL